MAKTDTLVRSKVTIGILGFEGCSAWITAGLIELFAIANVALQNLPRPAGGGTRPVRFDCHVIATSRGMARGSHGVHFATQQPKRRYDAVIVPPLWCESRHDLERRAIKLRCHDSLLVRLARRSLIMASACSGSVLLANAGLLANHRATTCWWLAEWFQQRFPDTKLVPDRLVMIDGDRWTAAAGSAYVHLGLELVGKFAGAGASATTARLMLVERRRGSQSPFMALQAMPREGIDADVERVARHLDEHAAERITIAGACKKLALNERTLTRKFQTAMGMSPLTYLQSRRIARARQLLEESALSLERIVERCGYEDISSFRKLFARHVGMTPREYRSRFGSMAPSNK
jgi:transcriptional regulator GlxA family with amidase domain